MSIITDLANSDLSEAAIVILAIIVLVLMVLTLGLMVIRLFQTIITNMGNDQKRGDEMFKQYLDTSAENQRAQNEIQKQLANAVTDMGKLLNQQNEQLANIDRTTTDTHSKLERTVIINQINIAKAIENLELELLKHREAFKIINRNIKKGLKS